MQLLRNILTAILCAVIIGTNLFGLIVLWRAFGVDVAGEPGVLWPAVQMGGLTVFAILSLVSTKYLWVVLAIAAMSLLIGFGFDVLVQRVWRPSSMLGSLFVIVPTYLLARWNSLARPTDFNPVKEF